MEESPQTRPGKLKIFFGYAAGVGKTYAMLEAAHNMLKTGVDVVAGYVEPHMRPETQALLDGLEKLPEMNIFWQDVKLREFDLDAGIRRQPQLLLVDEMAHTNARGCRHAKRYQDIQELLRHGIDVYTTVNVQHVESLNDVVESITGVRVRERVPDKVFDSADQVELVDIEPEQLLQRLQEGKIYRQEQAARALENFFTKENLVALREIALRRTADIINRSVEKQKNLHQRTDYFTNEHILVCLSSSPSNPKVIRTAGRMAEVFHGRLTALFVETSTSRNMSAENKARLASHARLAEQLGAHLVNVQGDDVPWHVTAFAKASGVSKIVIGRPGNTAFWLFRKSNFIDQLTALAPNLDIYVIPNQMRQPVPQARIRSDLFRFSWKELFWCVGLLTASTGVAFLLYAAQLSEADIVMAYMLGVLFAAITTNGLLSSVIYSLCSVLAFNFFFTEPRFSFQAYNPAHTVTFGIMLLSSIVTSTLATRLQQQKALASQKAYRTSLLLETSQKLQGARDSSEIIQATAQQLLGLLGRTVILYPGVNGRLAPPVIMVHESQADATPLYICADERAVAQWSFQNRKQAGAGTSTLSGAKCMYLCVRDQEKALAVAGVAVENVPLDAFEKGLLMAVLSECAMALEKERNRESKERISLQAQQESLRANLLRAISHDLRTPLTSISGNASVLLSSSHKLTDSTRTQLYADMYDDAVWLTSLVENILSMTRLDDEAVGLTLEPELLADLIQESLRHLSRKSGGHHLRTELEDELLMARVDAHLIIQVILNLVDNALKYTRPDSTIVISARRLHGMVEVSVRDDGDGITPEARERLFDMFFTAHHAAPDSRRGLGLGLFLCKSIVTAHGGEITVTDATPHGAVFSFTLPVAETDHA